MFSVMSGHSPKVEEWEVRVALSHMECLSTLRRFPARGYPPSQLDTFVPDSLTGDGVVRRAVQLVGHAHGIEHAPQHVQLELQDVQHSFLRVERAVMPEGDAQAVLDIAPRFLQALAEIVVTGRLDPGVMLRPGIQARLVDGRRE